MIRKYRNFDDSFLKNCQSTKKLWILIYDQKLRNYLLFFSLSFFLKHLNFFKNKYPLIAAKFYFWKNDFDQIARIVNLNIKRPATKIYSSDIINLLIKKKSRVTSHKFSVPKTITFLKMDLIRSQIDNSFYSTYLERKNLKDYYIKQFYVERKCDMEYLKILLEDNQIDLLTNLEKHTSYKFLNMMKKSREIFAYMHFLKGNIDKSKYLRSTIFKDSKKLRKEEFFGKKILIIGPAPVDSQEVINQNSFDIVIKTNIADLDFIATDALTISYYNSFFVHQEKDKLANVAPHLASLVFKSYDDLNGVLSEINTSLRKNLWVLHSLDNIYFSALQPMPMALQNILYDVTWIYPESVHVTGFDLYMNNPARNYSPNYIFYSTENILRTQAFRNHDPLNNFTFTKNLYESGFFTANSKLNSILEMSTEEYSKRLDALC